ncbi:MAG: GntR family transcriptional regulator [Pseudomonadota bacterium]
MYWSDRQIRSWHYHGLAYDLIKRQITIGSMRPGEQFPAERKLADTLGISRATLREALKKLEADGYVNATRGSKGGNFVASDDEINRIARTCMMAQPDQVWRSLEYLRAILDQASVLACNRRSPGTLNAMARAVELLQKAKTGGDLREAQYLFLDAFSRASINPLFVQGVEAALAGLCYPMPAESLALRADRTTKLGIALLEAFRTRDETQAAQLTTELVDLIADCVIKEMSSAQSNTGSSTETILDRAARSSD